LIKGNEKIQVQIQTKLKTQEKWLKHTSLEEKKKNKKGETKEKKKVVVSTGIQ
jgi:hypothetical protein